MEIKIAMSDQQVLDLVDRMEDTFTRMIALYDSMQEFTEVDDARLIVIRAAALAVENQHGDGLGGASAERGAHNARYHAC
jgi:hypothetical protein